MIVLFITLADSCLRPFLAVNKRNEIETDRAKLLQLYVQRYFLLDLLATIPFDYLLILIDDGIYVRYIRLFRLLKTYRLGELVELVRHHTTINMPVFRIGLLFGIYIVVAHWFNLSQLLAARWEYG